MAAESADLARDMGISKTVYALEFPEVIGVRQELLADGLASGVFDHAWTKKQDDMHAPFLDGWLEWAAEVCDLDDMAYRYPTNGSSEAIRDVLCNAAAARSVSAGGPVVHVFEGEYEGYEALATAYNVPVVKHNRAAPLARVGEMKAGDLFMLSQPSAVDGNIWDGYDGFMAGLLAAAPGVRVMLDLCYIGCFDRAVKINARWPNIESVFFSLSKSFGVYYWRVGGVFSRAPLPGLWGNMWFKNLASLAYGVALMKAIPSPRQLAARYKGVQEASVAALRPRFGADLAASDVVLLAHKTVAAPAPGSVEAFLARGPTVRFCLTPAMDRMITGGESA